MRTQNAEPSKADELWRDETLRYSICTIVTRPAQYREMVESFKTHGFHESDCEFLYLDNTRGNAFDAYTGCNLFLNVARGSHIIICHQDVLLIDDGRTKLDAIIEELNRKDSNWAICGNGGGQRPGQLAIRISDPHGDNQSVGAFPVKVVALDENFIVVRRSANLALSRDLTGFHFYGTDICVVADILGWSCYAVDFHLRHKSAGLRDKGFFQAREDVIRKYSRALRSRWVSTTCTSFFVSGVSLMSQLLSSDFVTRLTQLIGRKTNRTIPTESTDASQKP